MRRARTASAGAMAGATVAALAVLAGCAAPLAWSKPGVGEAERAKDDNWCAVLGEMEVQNLPDNQRFRAYAVWRETYHGCMQGKGYVQVPAPS